MTETGELLDIYRDTPACTRNGKPFPLWLNPPSGTEDEVKSIVTGKHPEVVTEVARITGSVGLRLNQPLWQIKLAAEVCEATGAALRLRCDPWKDKKDPFAVFDFGERYHRHLQYWSLQALERQAHTDHIGTVIVHHEEWNIAPENERAVRRHLDDITAILHEFLPDAAVTHYNYMQRRGAGDPPFWDLPANLSTDYRSCSLYFDRVDLAASVLQATSEDGQFPTVPWINFRESFWYKGEFREAEWFNSKKALWQWPDNYPRGEQYVEDLASMIRDAAHYVPAVVVYAPELLNPAFARRLQAFVRGVGR